MKLHLACFFLAGCSVAGCSVAGCSGADSNPFGDASNPDATTEMPDAAGMDGTMMSDTSTSDTGMMDGTIALDGGMDSGMCGLMPVDGGLGCNTLSTTGPSIKANCHGGGPPTAVGGVIQDGHYVLTGIDLYNVNTACPMETEKIDWVICGNQWETVQVLGMQSALHYNVVATVQSPKVSLAIFCPIPQTVGWSYDVKGQGLVFYFPGPNGSTRASTYSKM